MSFLQRLGKSSFVAFGGKKLSTKKNTFYDAQFKVDVVKTPTAIVVYAQLAGAKPTDIQVSIEGNADVLVVTGKRVRPTDLAFSKKRVAGTFFIQECTWENFERRINLPESIHIAKAKAKVKNGVLVLVLPTRKPKKTRSIKLKVKQQKAQKKR